MPVIKSEIFGTLKAEENHIIHKGRFSDVYLLKDKNLIIKKFNPKKKSPVFERERFKNEVILWKILYEDYPAELTENDNNLFIIRKLLPGNPLKEFSNVSIQQKEEWLWQVAQQIQKIHDAGFLHLDIKPSNIIVSGKHAFLIDFGSSVRLKNKKFPKGYVMPFSIIYAPQECVLNRYDLTDTSTDWFMWGMTAYELLTGELPVYHDNPAWLIHLQVNFQPVLKHLPAKWRKLLSKALSQYHFPKPYHYYSSRQVQQFIEKGKQNRIYRLSEIQNLFGKRERSES